MYGDWFIRLLRQHHITPEEYWPRLERCLAESRCRQCWNLRDRQCKSYTICRVGDGKPKLFVSKVKDW